MRFVARWNVLELAAPLGVGAVRVLRGHAKSSALPFIIPEPATSIEEPSDKDCSSRWTTREYAMALGIIKVPTCPKHHLLALHNLGERAKTRTMPGIHFPPMVN